MKHVGTMCDIHGRRVRTLMNMIYYNNIWTAGFLN